MRNTAFVIMTAESGTHLGSRPFLTQVSIFGVDRIISSQLYQGTYLPPD